MRRTCGHLVCSAWRRLRGRPYYGLMRSGEAGTDFFALVTSDRFPGNGLKLYQGRCRSDRGKEGGWALEPGSPGKWSQLPG